MPITRDFIFGVDEDTGLAGLIPTWIKDASPARSIAHDVLEHRFSESGSAVTAELMAIGAIVALRIENGAFHGRRPETEVLGFMVFEMLRDALNGKAIDSAGATRPVSDLDEWVEDLLQASVPWAFDLARAEDADASALAALRRDHFDDIIGWLRRGYRYARKRYRGADRYFIANTLFRQLDRASEDLVSQDILVEGDRVRVNVCARAGGITFEVNGYPLVH